MKDEKGEVVREERVARRNGALIEFPAGCEPRSPVVLMTVGKWCLMADEIDAAGTVPRLVHAGKAKSMSRSINRTDKLDVRGTNRLH